MDPLRKPTLPKLRYRPNTENIIKIVDLIIKEKLKTDTTLEELHSIVYTGAATVLLLNGQKLKIGKRKYGKLKLPRWEIRIRNSIDKLRREIGIITQSLSQSPSKKVTKIATRILRREKTIDNPTTIEILDLLKQKLSAKAKRLKRYQESNLRRQHNQLFHRSERIFYRNLHINEQASETVNVTLPKTETVREYWNGIWGQPLKHRKAQWLEDERKDAEKILPMENWEITQKEVKAAITKTLNWKAPGLDSIQNFWIKKFKSIHKQLARCFTHLLSNPEKAPSFLTNGVTYLLPKTEHFTDNPAKYRPITCLPTIYKILTSILAEKLYMHLEDNNLLNEEQKGCRKGSRGCKEQLIIDATVMYNAKQTQDSLHTAYIDYQKAFDSIPHSWLLEILDLYKIDKHISIFLAHAMTEWKTRLFIKAPEEILDVGTINIRRGIFQGDALSPLWFCLALRPLTQLLNKQNKGYTLSQTGTSISHLWYMDDLKIFAPTKQKLESLLTCVGKFSSDIHMKFGLDKCKISSMEKGKWARHRGFEVNEEQGFMEGMEEEERYKYLGYLQARDIDHKPAKQKLTETYLKRVRLILRTKLSARNVAKAVNTFAASAISYSFGVIKWTDTELEGLNIKTRKEFCKYRSHHPRSSIERFHLPRKFGGRGIPDMKARHHQQICNLREYFHKKLESSTLHKAVVKSDKKATPLRLAEKRLDTESATNEQLLDQWRSKPLHGKYLAKVEHESMDRFASLSYLSYGNIFNETEGFITAIQDQVIATKSYKKRILKENVANVKCRVCNSYEENLDHITAGCTMLAPKAYLERHNRVGKIIHQKLREKHMGLTDIIPHYEYEPPAVCENEDVRIYWDRKIQTDKTIPNNIPDLVLTFKKEKKTYIVDFAVPLSTNISKTYVEKINKYLPLRDEITEMWHMDSVTIIPIVIGTLGEIPKQLKENLLLLGLDWELYKPIQKSVLLDTCSIVRRVIGLK